jgi:hypothetical protein
MSDADDPLTRHGRGAHEGSASASPYPLSRLAPPHDLVDIAKQIRDADQMLSAVVGNQLKLIAEQIQSLQDKARALLLQAERNAELHRARCTFQKRVGMTCHLYRRDDDERYFSMLSPEDWGGTPPHTYEGSYRLEADMSWVDQAS